jgi:site-specific DNA-methyltransferase (cytosine-N4-specific)
MELPTQTQLILPLLETIHEAGGCASPGAIYDELAARLRITDEARNATSQRGDRGAVNLFERRVRWTRQTAVMKGLIARERRGVWALTEKANARLHNIVRGAVVTLFETSNGVFLWANAEDAVGIVERESVDLLCTSPPYPIVSPKAYGGLDQKSWVEWMLRLCEGWRKLIKPTGSIMLNLGACWMPGMPAQSLYQSRLLVRLEDELGIHLLQELAWHSPTKLPVPLNWVGVRRVRLTSSIEKILWLSPQPHLAKADNRRVLRPYTEGGLRSINDCRIQSTRPGGITFGQTSFQDRGGSIPPALITATPNSVEEHRYRKAVAAAGKQPHPALMPAAVARFCIKLATEENDTVADFFAGGCTIPVEAMKLRRYAIAGERSREYLETGFLRSRAEGLNPKMVAQTG